MLFYTTAILTILLGVIMHELGHAIAFRHVGVGVKRIGLLGFPGLGTIRLPIRAKMFPGTEWNIHLLLLGAYVEPVEVQAKAMSSRDKRYVSGMGPLAGILWGLILAVPALTLTLDDHIVKPTVLQYVKFAGLITIVVCLMTSAVYLLRRTIITFVFTPISIVLTALVCWKLGQEIVTFTFSPQGTKATAEAISKYYPVVSTWQNELRNGLAVGAFASVALSVVNLLCLLPLDGGHIIKTLLPKKWQDFYAIATAPIIAFLMLASIGRDIVDLTKFLIRLVW